MLPPWDSHARQMGVAWKQYLDAKFMAKFQRLR